MDTNGAIRKLNIRPDRIDFRDREYRPRVLNMPHIYPEVSKLDDHVASFANADMVLDQGSEGACTGFGLAAMINYVYWKRDLTQDQAQATTQVSPRMLYNNARLYDEWDGEDYGGSSCRGAMKGWHKHGVCLEKNFPYLADNNDARPEPGFEEDAAKRPLGAYYRVNAQSVVDMQAAITETGAIYASCKVHDGWKLKAASSLENTLITQGQDHTTGGHAFAIIGYTAQGFIVQNSWGPDWGFHGFAILPYDDWARNGYDAWVATLGAPTIRIKPQAAKTTDSLVDTAKNIEAPLEMIKSTSNSLSSEEVWDDQEAYKHVLVTGPGGVLLRRLTYTETAKDNLNEVLKAIQENAETFENFLFFAFAGLQSEKKILQVIHRMGPAFKKNGIYPIFIVPAHELYRNFFSIRDANTENFIAQRAKLKSKGAHSEAIKSLSEKRDSTFELRARNFLGLSLWSQVYRDAYYCGRKGVAADICRYLGIFRKDKAHKHIKFHVAAHSVGSLFMGHFIDRLDRAFKTRGGAIETTTFWAPACSMEFAGDVLFNALQDRVMDPTQFRIVNLASRHDLSDQVVDESLYGKSILHLASRALEDKHKTAMLGMADCWKDLGFLQKNEVFNSGSLSDIRKWREQQDYFDMPSPLIVSRDEFHDSRNEIPVTHLNMLHDKALLEQLIEQITGNPLSE